MSTSFFQCRTALACVVALLVVASCDRPAAGERVVELRFWNGFTGPDGRTMLAIVRRFNETHPGVRVTMQRMDWATYYNKLFVAGRGGRAPHLFVVHTETLSRLRAGGFVRAIDDLTGPGKLNAGDIDPNVWQAASHDGRHYGVPIDIHLDGMYYNRKLFREAGLVDERGEPKPPTNRAEFLDAVKKLRATGAQNWGFVFTWLRNNAYCLMRQNGGDVMDAAGNVTLDSPANAAALGLLRSLVTDGVAPTPENYDAWVGFLQGRVGMAFEGIYMLPDLRRQSDLDYGAAPLPTLGDHPAAHASSHNVCVRADLSGDELAAAGVFVKYLSDNSLDWADGGQVPVRRSLRDTDRFRMMKAQSAFAKQIPIAAYYPASPFVFEYEQELDFAVERVLKGRLPPEAALKQAAAAVERVVDRNREATP